MSTYFNVLGRVGKVKAIGEKMTIIDLASDHVYKNNRTTVWANVMFYTESISKVLPYIKAGDTLFVSGRLSTIKDKTTGYDRLQLMGDKIDLTGFSKGKIESPDDAQEATTETEVKSDEDAPW